jgi:hypothetical protein
VNALPAGDYVITTSQSYDPVIAAVPLMALVGLAAFLAFYLIRLAESVPRPAAAAVAAASPLLEWQRHVISGAGI